MRGAGCTWNDIVDRDLDGRVERTRSRPIPSGQVTVRGAAAFLVAQALVGLAVLVQFNGFAIACGIASLGVVAIYPFMKRFTYWPQIGLGLAFSWGALMGWAAVFGRLDLPAYLLYAGSIAWVIGYDTIYAHQDREDDALIGIHSTALLFRERTKPMLAACYALAVVLMALAGWLAGGGLVFAIGLVALRGTSGVAGRAGSISTTRRTASSCSSRTATRASFCSRHWCSMQPSGQARQPERTCGRQPRVNIALRPPCGRQSTHGRRICPCCCAAAASPSFAVPACTEWSTGCARCS